MPASSPDPYRPPAQPRAEDRSARDAGFEQRLIATLIDLAALAAPVLLGISRSSAGLGPTAKASGGWIALGGLVLVVAFQLALMPRGQSIGKVVAGIKVVNLDGSAISFLRYYFVRFPTALVLLALPGLNLIDILFFFKDKQQRCLHDRIADSRVVVAQPSR